MRSELRLAPHALRYRAGEPGILVIEIWFAGQLVGEMRGAEGAPGVKVTSTFGLTSIPDEVGISVVICPPDQGQI